MYLEPDSSSHREPSFCSGFLQSFKDLFVVGDHLDTVMHYQSHCCTTFMIDSLVMIMIIDAGGAGGGMVVVDPVEGTSTGGTGVEESSLDVGDGRSNDLVDSCPYFRNEVGGELQRTVSFSRRQHRPVVSTGQTQYLVHSAESNGVSVLDCSTSSDGDVLPPLLLHNNLVVEYVDRGATYYRRFFYDHGTVRSDLKLACLRQIISPITPWTGLHLTSLSLSLS